MMKLKNLFTLSTIFLVLFALGFMLIPVQLSAFFGNAIEAGGVLYARLLGAASLALAAITWFSREAADSDARRAIILGGLIYSAAGLIITLVAQFTGTMNEYGWAIVAIYALFAIDYGYSQFAKAGGSKL